ncbi:MAG: phosphate butyryltransferase [Firmicutes bacterium]|jgi:phosphate butyryltransferase|nr:phosphate butyryltransferase [Bacillota bacterium]
MVIKSFAHLKTMITAKEEVNTLAAVCPNDQETILALKEAVDLGICRVLAFGQKEIIEPLWLNNGGKEEDFQIIDAEDGDEAAKLAVAAVREGKAQSILKGNLETAQLLSKVVDREHGIRDSKLLSHLAFFEIPGYHKLIGLTDSGMVLYPDYEQKKIILENAVKFYKDFGYQTIKISVLSAVEKPNPKILDTIDASKLQEENRSGFLPEAIIEGPLSYDITMSKEVAEKKRFTSQVSGDCDLMLIDNMTSGNILGKSLIMSAKAKMAGVVVGGKAPIALNSRGSSHEEKLNAIILASYFS